MKSTHIKWQVARPRHAGMAFLIIFNLMFASLSLLWYLPSADNIISGACV
jgi:hypothetical protein